MRLLVTVGAFAAMLSLGIERCAVAAELTANQLLNGLRATSGDQAVGFFLETEALGITWANADLVARNQRPILCLTPHPGLTQPRLIELEQQIVRDMPALGERPAGMALLIALKRAFPCASS